MTQMSIFNLFKAFIRVSFFFFLFFFFFFSFFFFFFFFESGVLAIANI